ncbi:TPM domain-containing protein [Acinetobacter calcoaceticus]|uniref:TPM domain-containing protein n=1 Tax=Acinetobacter calcoaceticus TaxID=471 RepID=UPI003219AA62
MVTTSETTQIITQPKIEESVESSLKRWFKHLCYFPASSRYFSKQDKQTIADAVQQAEHGHVGEIQVVIEGHIPCSQAYRQNTRLRAQQLFAELGVWDTALNSGVLLYLNLCERTVEIIFDRGIRNATNDQVWQQICDSIVQQLKQKQYQQAVVIGVHQIGEVMSHFYDENMQDQSNELGNAPIIIN